MRIKSTTQGEITVFLSLVLLLVLALVGTMIETVRVNTARGMAERALEMSLDSVFTQYGRTLYDDYHVFFLENSKEGDGSLLDLMEEYMDYSLEPNKDVKLPGTEYQLPNVNLWGIHTDQTELLETIYATDYKGNIFINQAVNYMKYRTGTEQLEGLMEQLEFMDSTSKTTSVVEEKLEVEESLAELDYYIIECIKLTDGISFRKSGVQYTSNGLLKTEPNFIKQFCPLPISSSNLGINNNLVWSSLVNQYINPINKLEQMRTDIQAIQEKEIQINSLTEQAKQLTEQLASQAEQSEHTEQKMEERENKEKENDEISKQLESIYESITQLESEISSLISAIKDNKNLITQVSSKIIPKLDEMLKIIPKISQKQKQLSSEVDGFEGVLAENKEEMVQDVYHGMEEDLSYMKQYVGKESASNEESMAFRIQQMKPILESNRAILEGCSQLGRISIAGRDSDWAGLLSEIGSQIISLKQYQVKQLSFDYSSLKPKSEVPNPIQSLNQAVGNGILELVIEDTGKLSKKNISIPDNLYLLQKAEGESLPDDTVGDTDYVKVLPATQEEGYSSEITQSFGNYSDMTSFQDNALKSGNQLATLLLWSEYIDAHFMDYRNSGQIQEGKETALNYEKEYLLGAKGSDKENLQAVITKLLMIRTILNFIFIIGDSQKREMAYATAAALVGYTCLEPLVRITQVLILLTWSVAESIVDIAGILVGKSVPIIKDKTSFLIKYNELFLMSKTFVQSKVKLISDKKGTLCLGYNQYLKLMIFMVEREKQAYRTMDLIQENLRLRYRNEFDISKCIYGIGVSARWTVPSKFIRLSFVANLLNQQKDSWVIIKEQDYSY